VTVTSSRTKPARVTAGLSNSVRLLASVIFIPTYGVVI
jgi:hypothetical protein